MAGLIEKEIYYISGDRGKIHDICFRREELYYATKPVVINRGTTRITRNHSEPHRIT